MGKPLDQYGRGRGAMTPPEPGARPGLWIAAAVVLGGGAGGGLWMWDDSRRAERPSEGLLREDMDPDDPFVRDVAECLEDVEGYGDHLSNLYAQRGIRADAGENPTAGEIKVMVNLDWQALPGSPTKREAVDLTAAHCAVALFETFERVTKIRVIVKLPKEGLPPDPTLGIARGHYSAAKLFSMTRSAYETGPRRVDEDDPAAILELGDYVVLGAEGWQRGY